MSDVLAQIAGNVAQELIAGMVSMCVVDLLEAVEVEHEEGKRRTCAAATIERDGKAIFERPPVGQPRELVVQGEPTVIGDLLFQHDQDHTDGDEGLLHVPDVRGDVGIGAVSNDEGVQKEEERPDGEAGNNGEAACAVTRQLTVEVHRGNGIDDAQAPVDHLAVSAIGGKQTHPKPSYGEHQGRDQATAKIERGGHAEDEPECDPWQEGGLREEVQAIGGAEREQRDGVDQEKEEALPVCDLIIPGGPHEDETGQQVADDHDRVKGGAGRSVGTVKDVCARLDQGKKQSEEPEIRLSLRMVAAKQQQDDDEDRQSQEIGKKSVVHQVCFLVQASFYKEGPSEPADGIASQN